MNTVDFSKCILDCKFPDAFSQIKSFPSYNHIKVWSENEQEMSTIIKNLFTRNFSRTGNIHNRPAINYGENSIDTMSIVPKQEERNKMMRKIATNVSSLDSPIRLVFDMHRNGYNYNEIASCFNIPLETVRERITYAKKVVREAILETCIEYRPLRLLTA